MGANSVRNMGNFNLLKTHVLTFFHHVEQCCYPSFLIIPHIPAMTSHIAYVIYATITLITTQGLCNITFSLYFFSSMHLGPYSFLMILMFLFLSHIHVALLTLCRIRNQVYLSTRNRSTLKTTRWIPAKAPIFRHQPQKTPAPQSRCDSPAVRSRHSSDLR